MTENNAAAVSSYQRAVLSIWILHDTCTYEENNYPRECESQRYIIRNSSGWIRITSGNFPFSVCSSISLIQLSSLSVQIDFSLSPSRSRKTFRIGISIPTLPCFLNADNLYFQNIVRVWNDIISINKCIHDWWGAYSALRSFYISAAKERR